MRVWHLLAVTTSPPPTVTQIPATAPTILLMMTNPMNLGTSPGARRVTTRSRGETSGVILGEVSPAALVTAANMRPPGNGVTTVDTKFCSCRFGSPISPVQQMNPSVPCSDESRQLCALLRQGRRAREGGVAKDHATWFWAASHRRA